MREGANLDLKTRIVKDAMADGNIGGELQLRIIREMWLIYLFNQK